MTESSNMIWLRLLLLQWMMPIVPDNLWPFKSGSCDCGEHSGLCTAASDLEQCRRCVPVDYGFTHTHSCGQARSVQTFTNFICDMLMPDAGVGAWSENILQLTFWFFCRRGWFLCFGLSHHFQRTGHVTLYVCLSCLLNLKKAVPWHFCHVTLHEYVWKKPPHMSQRCD